MVICLKQKKTATEIFKNGDEVIVPQPPAELSFAERALKRQKSVSSVNSEEFIDTRFVLPTSNDCERLFSKVKYLWDDRRQSLLPMNLESQLFLNLNYDLWSVKDIMDLPE